MAAVLCLGEVMVDWICTTNGGANEGTTIERHLAGVPANVAVGLARQNVTSAVLARVGGDRLGHWAKAQLRRENVDVTGLKIDDAAATRTAFVAPKPNGERETLWVMLSGCADSRLSPEDLRPEQFASASALYFGSTALSQSPASETVAKAIGLASEHNLLVVTDANIWPAMWNSDEECRTTVLDTLKFVDVLKVNLDELEFLTGARALDSAVTLRNQTGVPLVIVTCGAHGAFVSTAAGTAQVAPFPLELVEAAGAGDALVAAVIASLLPLLNAQKNRREQLRELPVAVVAAAVQRGNAAGALVCSRVGALSAMPTSAEIDAVVLQALDRPGRSGP